jgi:hypothetical protein
MIFTKAFNVQKRDERRRREMMIEQPYKRDEKGILEGGDKCIQGKKRKNIGEG